VQLYPGAMMVDLVAYVGYRIRRVSGALAATAGFIAPALVLMLGLSWLYATYGAAPGVAAFVVGLDSIVVGVLASIAIDFALQYARDILPALLALVGFTVAVSGANALLAVGAGLVLGALALRSSAPREAVPAAPGHPATSAAEAADGAAEASIAPRRLALALLPGLAVVLAALVAAASGGTLAALYLDMTRIGAVAFGNGSTITPILQQDAVEGRHWLTLSAFTVAVAFGQLTPGPFLISATFVGYQVAGLWGGLLATLGIFAPSVAMTTVAAEIYPLLRRWAWVRGAVAGIMAVFVGLLAGVALTLGRPILGSPGALVLLGAAFVAIRVARWNLLLVFGAGLAAWGLYLALGGAA
jgi:chromate transporter